MRRLQRWTALALMLLGGITAWGDPPQSFHDDAAGFTLECPAECTMATDPAGMQTLMNGQDATNFCCVIRTPSGALISIGVVQLEPRETEDISKHESGAIAGLQRRMPGSRPLERAALPVGSGTVQYFTMAEDPLRLRQRHYLILNARRHQMVDVILTAHTALFAAATDAANEVVRSLKFDGATARSFSPYGRWTTTVTSAKGTVSNWEWVYSEDGKFTYFVFARTGKQLWSTGNIDQFADGHWALSTATGAFAGTQDHGTYQVVDADTLQWHSDVSHLDMTWKREH